MVIKFKKKGEKKYILKRSFEKTRKKEIYIYIKRITNTFTLKH